MRETRQPTEQEIKDAIRQKIELELAQEEIAQEMLDARNKAIFDRLNARPQLHTMHKPEHMQAVHPDLEWVFDGHSDIKHPETGEERRIVRCYHLADVPQPDGTTKRKALYAMVHSYGVHQADIYHTYPKDQWTYDEAKAFHDARVAHESWTAPPAKRKRCWI